MEEKNKKIINVITNIIISSVTGFGMFWLYKIIGCDVFASIFIGMITSSALTIILNNPISTVVDKRKQAKTAQYTTKK